MLVPPNSWPELINRSASIGFPITQDGGFPVNVVRRYLDAKAPKYKGLSGCGHHVGPDIGGWRGARSGHSPLLLVCGMRDVCFARAAELNAHTNTGGVEGWLKLDVSRGVAANKSFAICLDRGEEWFAGPAGAAAAQGESGVGAGVSDTTSGLRSLPGRVRTEIVATTVSMTSRQTARRRIGRGLCRAAASIASRRAAS
jgi:hypothetical protein